MTTEQWTRIWDLLDRALDRPPEEQMEWLDTVCADAPKIRAEVKSMLAAYDPTDPLFTEAEMSPRSCRIDAPSGPSGPTDAAVRPEPGAQVGAYRLVEEIGVGGMSVVYQAVRDGGSVQQTVAVKILHRRLSEHEAEKRFQAERQVLASLNHPNIAQFIDGGVTERGRPYLVMEYVDGQPITEYASTHHLDLGTRLDLLAQVFDAVQAAHRQLVVHRDLKPSNVLVADTVSGPQVTLVDFGIAKLLDNSLPTPLPKTRTGHRLLTPSYAAPEQVSEQDISTVTDVYQIGVLAYELLAEARPFDLTEKRSSEIETIIRTHSPADPSAAAPPPRASRLRGDLDQIVQTALRKEPDRRYASVEALAADVNRYRDGKPIDAQPATLSYRIRKFVSRNWGSVSVSIAFLLTLGVFIGLLVRQQRITAAERNRAQQEAETAEQVSAFLVSLFEDSRPGAGQGEPLTAPELLERGVTRAEALKKQPVVQARMLREMAASYRELGDYERAASLLREALSLSQAPPVPPAAERAEYLDELGLVYEKQGRYTAAESVHRAALSLRTHRLGVNDPKTAETLNNLGVTLRKQGKPEAADSLYRKALSIQKQERGPQHPRTATTMNNLGIVLAERAQYAAADSFYQEALRIRQTKLGPDHPDVAETLHNLALLREQQGKYGTADSLLQKTLAIERNHLGPHHPSVAITLNNLGMVWRNLRKYDAAVSAYRKALTIKRKVLGPNHIRTTSTLNNLAVTLEKKGEYAAADSMYRKLFAIERTHYDLDHPTLSTTYNNWGVVREKTGDYAAADSLYDKALTIREAHYGPKHPRTASTLMNMGSLYRQRGEYVAADSVLRKALRIRQQALGKEHPKVAESQIDLADVRQALGQYKDAEDLLQHALNIQQAEIQDAPPETAETAHHLVELYETWDKPAKAEEYRTFVHQRQEK